jgi:hypothetical protein
MAVLATDDFTRANSSDLGTSWDTVPSELAWQLVSNQAKSPSIDNDGAESYNGVVWPDNQWSQGTAAVSATVWSAGDGVGLALRCSVSVKSYYRLVVNTNGSNNVEYGKKVNGTHSTLVTRTAAFANGNTLYFEVQGTSLLAKIGGVAVGTPVTDSALSTGRVGLAYSGETNAGTNSGTIDDWSGGDFLFPAGVPQSASPMPFPHPPMRTT